MFNVHEYLIVCIENSLGTGTMLFIYIDYVSFNISWFLKVWLTMNIFVIHIFKHEHDLGLSECKMCVFV